MKQFLLFPVVVFGLLAVAAGVAEEQQSTGFQATKEWRPPSGRDLQISRCLTVIKKANTVVPGLKSGPQGPQFNDDGSPNKGYWVNSDGNLICVIKTPMDKHGGFVIASGDCGYADVECSELFAVLTVKSGPPLFIKPGQ